MEETRAHLEEQVASARVRVGLEVEWRVPGFAWTADQLTRLYEDRHTFDEEVREALEVLYRYDVPLRRYEEELVQGGLDPLQNYLEFQAALTAFEDAFWKAQVLDFSDSNSGGNPDETLANWWKARRSGARGPLTRTLVTQRSATEVAAHVQQIALGNDLTYEGVKTVPLGGGDDQNPAKALVLALQPRRHVETLIPVNPAIIGMLPYRIVFRPVGKHRIEVIVPSILGQLLWESEYPVEVLKALAWFDVIEEMLLTCVDWLR